MVILFCAQIKPNHEGQAPSLKNIPLNYCIHKISSQSLSIAICSEKCWINLLTQLPFSIAAIILTGIIQTKPSLFWCKYADKFVLWRYFFVCRSILPLRGRYLALKTYARLGYSQIILQTSFIHYLGKGFTITERIITF